MGDFPEDVVRYVEHKFDSYDIPSVYGWLDHPVLTTPRVIRSLLFLSNGSLTLLQHYFSECLRNTNDVLMEAEYVSGVTDEPMRARDMSVPFTHRRNLGRDYLRVTSPVHEQDTLRVMPGRGRRRLHSEDHHQRLVGAQFYLGEVMYVVAKNQDRADVVRCYRVKDSRMRAVTLPVLFVLEHVAEESIELEAVF